MGIVSFCPNGHRTKLKDRFAGLRVRCPECGAKFLVKPVQPAGAAPEQPAAVEPPEPAARAAEPEPAPMPAAIAEAVDALWCVALPGGEASPARTAAEMQIWLEGDEPTGNELVWRSDWSDWKPIAGVFPECFDNRP